MPGTPATPGASIGSALVFGARTLTTIEPGGAIPTQYLYPGHSDDPGSPTPVEMIIPVPAGILRNLYVVHNQPTGGTVIRYTVRVDGSPTPLLVDIAGTTTQGENTTVAIPVAQGSFVAVTAEPLTAPTGTPSVPSDIIVSFELAPAPAA